LLSSKHKVAMLNTFCSNNNNVAQQTINSNKIKCREGRTQ